MRKTLQGLKVAILVSNGFNQQDFTETQKLLNAAGAGVKVVSPDQGLVNGWEGTGWGHHFPVDQQLATALGADFDMLVIPGGQRSMDKLKTTAHTKRIVNSFMSAGKKVVMFGDAVSVLDFAGQNTDVSMHDNLMVVETAEDIAAIVPFLAQQDVQIPEAA